MLVLLGGVMQVSATYYIAGTYNNWNTDFAQMTENSDGTYSYTYKITSNQDQMFAFSPNKGSNGWQDFNNGRISPGSSNQEITTFNTFVSLETGGNDQSAYYFTPKDYYNADYTITLDPVNNKVKISLSFSDCKVYVLGDIDSQSWAASTGTEMDPNNGVYTKTVTLNGNDKYFAYTTKLGTNWNEIKQYRFKGRDEFNVVGDVEMSTNSTTLPPGTYDLKVDLNTGKISATMVSSGYKYITSSDGSSWTEGGALSESNGVYSATLPSIAGKYFAIIPSDISLSGTTLSNWNYAIRPLADSNTFIIYFQSYNSWTVNNTSKNGATLWQLDTNNDCFTTITYTPETGSYTLAPYRTTTIGTAGYTTWSNGEKYAIDGTNVDDVYVVSADNNKTVTLTSVKNSTFPAGEGVIIKGSGEVKINAVASDASTSSMGTNYLVGSGNSTATPGTGDNIYVFSWKNNNPSTVGFYKASGGTLAAHKAYLQLPISSLANEFLGFDFGETTGIANIDVNDNVNFNADAPMYNLAGQRVSKSYKGVVIQNGKKMLNK